MDRLRAGIPGGSVPLFKGIKRGRLRAGIPGGILPLFKGIEAHWTPNNSTMAGKSSASPNQLTNFN